MKLKGYLSSALPRNLIILGSVVVFIAISFFGGISEIRRTNAEASRLSIGKEVNTLTGHTAPVTSVIFSLLSKTVASASLDKTVKLW